MRFASSVMASSLGLQSVIFPLTWLHLACFLFSGLAECLFVGIRQKRGSDQFTVLGQKEEKSALQQPFFPGQNIHFLDPGKEELL